MRYFILITLACLAFLSGGCGKNPVFSMMNEVAPSSGGTVSYAEGTMLWGYNLAKVKAIAWQSDAKYIGCISPSVDANGKGVWRYRFNSATDTANTIRVLVVDASNITTEIVALPFSDKYNIDFSCFKSNSDVWIKMISDTTFKSGAMDVSETWYMIDYTDTVYDVYYVVNSSATSYSYHVHLYPGFSIEKADN
ncbi:MAG: hypothetical protein V1662_06380 [Candidatus Omnitrophota bacterium]